MQAVKIVYAGGEGAMKLGDLTPGDVFRFVAVSEGFPSWEDMRESYMVAYPDEPAWATDFVSIIDRHWTTLRVHKDTLVMLRAC
jgi:hypothetical protein